MCYITDITAENIENAKHGDIIKTPYKGDLLIEKYCYQVNLVQAGKVIYRDYEDNYIWSVKENTIAARLHQMYSELARWALTA